MFRANRKQSCGNWGVDCVEERISLVSVKENTYWIIQIYYVQSSSGVVVKLGILSELHSSLYNKASITQKSNRGNKNSLITFPTRYPTFASHRPTLPFLAQLLFWNLSLFLFIHAKKTKWKFLYTGIAIFQTTLHGKANLFQLSAFWGTVVNSVWLVKGS